MQRVNFLGRSRKPKFLNKSTVFIANTVRSCQDTVLLQLPYTPPVLHHHRNQLVDTPCHVLLREIVRVIRSQGLAWNSTSFHSTPPATVTQAEFSPRMRILSQCASSITRVSQPVRKPISLEYLKFRNTVTRISQSDQRVKTYSIIFLRSPS